MSDRKLVIPVFRCVHRNVLEISIKKIWYLKYRTYRVDDVQIDLRIEEIEFK